MSMQIRNLSVLAYANGFTLWHYKAGKDILATVTAKDFFSDAKDMLTPGDLLMISASDGCRIVSAVQPGMAMTITVPLA